MKKLSPLLIASAIYLLAGCKKKEEPPVVPNPFAEVTTSEITSITENSAVSGGMVTSGGTSPVTAVGVCWDVNPNPTTLKPHTSNGAGVGSYTSALTGLMPGTKYYVRAYVNNNSGTGYGPEMTFKTLPAWTNINTMAQYPSDVDFNTCGNALFCLNEGRILKSTDGGVSWNFSDNGLVGGGRFFVNGNDLYSGLAKSTNNGGSWTQMPWNLGAYPTIFAVNGSSIYVHGGNGFHKSSDNGNTWTKITNGLPNNNSIRIGIRHGNSLFLAYDNGCYRSDNDGESWTKTSTGLPGSIYAYRFASNGNRLFLAISTAIYYTDNNGDNWTHIGTNLGAVYGVQVFDNKIFARIAGGFQVSADNGATWSLLSTKGLTGTSLGILTYLNSTLYMWRSTDGFWKFPLE